MLYTKTKRYTRSTGQTEWQRQVAALYATIRLIFHLFEFAPTLVCSDHLRFRQSQIFGTIDFPTLKTEGDFAVSTICG